MEYDPGPRAGAVFFRPETGCKNSDPIESWRVSF